MINLQKEIKDLLFKKSHMSLHQIAGKLKIEHCFVLNAIASTPEVRECGKYFNTSNNEIENYYTVSDGDLTTLIDMIRREEKIKQVVKMTTELEKEIKSHSGNKYSLSAAYEIAKGNGVLKTTPNYFLLDRSDILYAYEIALGKRNLAFKETVRVNYLWVLSLAA